jgi:hypothetical protein
MTYQEVAALIESIGLPYAYDHFEVGDAVDPPFICFFFSGSADFAADDTNYQKIRPLTLELYTENKDFSLEETVEAALNAAGLVYSRSEVYIDSERMYEVTYTAEIIITEE